MTPATSLPANGPASTAAKADPAQPGNKLAKAAQEFEAILLASWLEKMNQGFVGTEQSQDPAHDTVCSLGTQAIASALAARGGIGIAGMLLRQLHPATRPAAAEKTVPSGTLAAGSTDHQKD